MFGSEFRNIFLDFFEVIGGGVCKSEFFLNFASSPLAPVASSASIDIFIAFLQTLLHTASIILVIALNFAEIDSLLQFSINPVAAANELVIDIILAFPCDLSILKLSNILASILEEEIALAVLFEISDLAVVDLSLGVLYFTLVNQVVIFPLACDHFP